MREKACASVRKRFSVFIYSYIRVRAMYFACAGSAEVSLGENDVDTTQKESEVRGNVSISCTSVFARIIHFFVCACGMVFLWQFVFAYMHVHESMLMDQHAP